MYNLLNRDHHWTRVCYLHHCFHMTWWELGCERRDAFTVHIPPSKSLWIKYQTTMLHVQWCSSSLSPYFQWRNIFAHISLVVTMCTLKSQLQKSRTLRADNQHVMCKCFIYRDANKFLSLSLSECEFQYHLAYKHLITFNLFLSLSTILAPNYFHIVWKFPLHFLFLFIIMST